jgi:GNAT superfamily N-acetyltransferase
MTGVAIVKGGHFRFAEARDVDALVHLVETTYRGDASRKGWTTEADFLDGQRTDTQEIQEILENPRSRVILYEEDDGALLGCCNVEKEEEGVAYFGMFSVRAPDQGKGAGRALLSEAERFAKEEWGARVMRMTVIDIRDELIAFYERRGYVRTGKHKPFPYGNPRFGVPKRGDLRFELLEKQL